MNSYPGKRALDVMIAGTACVAFAPLVAGLAVATWLEDRGAPLFTQPRVGQRRRPFTLLKLRSMREQQITSPPADSPQPSRGRLLGRVGHWLRRTGIDELPQFANVLLGDMSIVGPRPLTQRDVERLGWNTRLHDWRFVAKPGITGLSQLLAGGGARASERLDRLYLRRQNPILDLQLIALSAAVNVLGKRTVQRWLRPTSIRGRAATPAG